MKVKLQSPVVFEEEKGINPRVKDVLVLLGGGVALAAFVVFPGLAWLFRDCYRDKYSEYKHEDWDSYNQWKLRAELKRLREQKDVEIVVQDGMPVVQLTEKGRRKMLRYNLDKLELDSKQLDGKWRLVIYDIPEREKSARDYFNSVLKSLKFMQLQKSVYLTPFPCENVIGYVREVFGIGEYVQIVTVRGLENENVYRRYFGI